VDPECREMTGSFDTSRRLCGVVFCGFLAVLRMAGAAGTDGDGDPVFEVFRYGSLFDDGVHNIRQTADDGDDIFILRLGLLRAQTTFLETSGRLR
jgi:hypothetical protein